VTRRQAIGRALCGVAIVCMSVSLAACGADNARHDAVSVAASGTVTSTTSIDSATPSSTTTTSTTSALAPTGSITALVQSAARVVDQLTGVMPTEGQVFSTTRAAAAADVGASVGAYGPSQPVYVVLFRGQFTDGASSRPSGALPYTGTTITFVYTQADQTQTDYSIGPTPAGLADLGLGQTVPVSS
jgi:hypothetical protein